MLLFQFFCMKHTKYNNNNNNNNNNNKQKPKELEGMKKGKLSIVRTRCLKKTLKNFTETWA
jgi:hypothetical protein